MRYIFLVIILHIGIALQGQPTYRSSESYTEDQISIIVDSLNENQNYNAIKGFCLPLLGTSKNYIAELSLICAMHNLGDSSSSYKLLKQNVGYQNDHFSLLKFSSLLSSPKNDIRVFFRRPEHKDYLESLASTCYIEKVHSRNSKLGLNLLHLLLNDQWIRGEMNYNAQKHKPAFSNISSLTDSTVNSIDKLNVDSVYNFYKRTQRILSKDEIGDVLNAFQFLLLAHDADTAHRSYYRSLITAAVKNETCAKERLADFDLRTQMMIEGQKAFFKTLPERKEKIKRELGLDDEYELSPY